MAGSLKIGLTGGIASGKSTVAGLFREKGVPVIDADELARQVVVPGSEGLSRLVNMLGPEILDASGHLDRKQLRRRIFADVGLRRQVESILHPLILERLQSALDACRAPYCIADIPLLVESGLGDRLDRVLVIDCPESVQAERLVSRDGVTAEEAHRMLASQTSRASRLAASDDRIVNNDGVEALAEQVEALHRQYLALARTTREDPPDLPASRPS